MSITWMAFVAALIAAEKLLPSARWRLWEPRSSSSSLGVLMIASPGSIPGLTIPGHGGMMGGMMK